MKYYYKSRIFVIMHTHPLLQADKAHPPPTKSSLYFNIFIIHCRHHYLLLTVPTPKPVTEFQRQSVAHDSTLKTTNSMSHWLFLCHLVCCCITGMLLLINYLSCIPLPSSIWLIYFSTRFCLVSLRLACPI